MWNNQNRLIKIKNKNKNKNKIKNESNTKIYQTYCETKQASINKLFKSISEIGLKFHRELFRCEEFHCEEFQ